MERSTRGLKTYIDMTSAIPNGNNAVKLYFTKKSEIKRVSGEQEFGSLQSVGLLFDLVCLVRTY